MLERWCSEGEELNLAWRNLSVLAVACYNVHFRCCSHKALAIANTGVEYPWSCVQGWLCSNGTIAVMSTPLTYD